MPGPGSGTPAVYVFRASSRKGDDDRRRRFLTLLGTALTTGQGLGVEFSLGWVTGPRARIELTVDSPLPHHWLTHTVFPVYEAGQWTRTAAPGSGPLPPPVCFAAPYRRAPMPLSDDPREAAWADAVVQALVQLPAGWRVEWRFVADALPDGLIPLTAEPDPPHASRTLASRAPPSAPERSLRDRAMQRPAALAWWATGSIRATSPRAGREPPEDLLRVVQVSSRDLSGNRLEWRSVGRLWARGARPFPLTTRELTGFLPGQETRSRGRSAVVDGTRSTLWVGRSADGSAVGLAVHPAEGRHLLVLGETGMGKSSALVALARQASRLGGVVLFDPLGETAAQLVAALPADELPRVLWISPTESPIAINALAADDYGPGSTSVARARQTAELVDGLRRVRAGRYADSPFWGPRIEEITRLALDVAGSIPAGTIEDALRLLDGARDPPPAVPPVARPSLTELRGRLQERPEEGDGARRLLGEVVRDPVLHRLLCERRPRLAISELVAPGRISLVCGEAARVGEPTARYLLATYLALLWPRVVQRPVASKLFLLLDEAQWYVHDSAVQILRMGRRFNVHLWTATQGLRSLPESFAEAVVTNSSDLVLFRGSPDDARAFERWGTPVGLESLIRLERGTAALLRDKANEADWVTLPRLASPATDSSRWSRVRDTARPYWPDSPGPPPGAAETPEPPHRPLDPSDPGEALVLLLWAALQSEATGSPARVSLSHLRRAGDPDGRQVRALGRELSREGVISGSGRDAAGSFWLVDRESFSARIAGHISAVGMEWAEARWRVSGADGPVPPSG